MLKVTLTREQMQNLFWCLDVALKHDGLNSLPIVTDLHNALVTAQEVPETQPAPVAVPKKKERKQYDDEEEEG